MKQQAVRFGTHREMIGILASADGQRPLGERVVLTWNTGISHHIGPHRLAVDISHSLTRVGLPVFRFDLSGRGDSLPRRGSPASALMNVQEAMDFLQEKWGFRQFILHGLCSGAVEAHDVARADKRVIGLSMVDTYAYPVGDFRLHYILKRLRYPSIIIRKIKTMLTDAKPTKESESLKDQYFVPFPPLEKVREDFQDFVSRRMPCLVIYTSGYDYVYNYHNQFFDMLKGIPVRPILTLERFTEADHLFTYLDQRYRFMETLCTWILHNFVEESQRSRVDLVGLDLAIS